MFGLASSGPNGFPGRAGIIVMESPRASVQQEGVSISPITPYSICRKRRRDILSTPIGILEVEETPSFSTIIDDELDSKDDELEPPVDSPDRRIHLTSSSYRRPRLGILIHPSPPARKVGRGDALVLPMPPPQFVKHAQRSTDTIVSCGTCSDSAANSRAAHGPSSSLPPRDPRCLISRVDLLPAHKLILDCNVDSDQSQ